MQTVPIHQAKSQLSELVRAVEQGEEVVLTRHGKRVIRLVKEQDAEEPNIEAKREAIIAELKALREKVGAGQPGFGELWDEHKRTFDERAGRWNAAKDTDAGR